MLRVWALGLKVQKRSLHTQNMAVDGFFGFILIVGIFRRDSGTARMVRPEAKSETDHSVANPTPAQKQSKMPSNREPSSKDKPLNPECSPKP